MLKTIKSITIISRIKYGDIYVNKNLFTGNTMTLCGADERYGKLIPHNVDQSINRTYLLNLYFKNEKNKTLSLCLWS